MTVALSDELSELNITSSRKSKVSPKTRYNVRIKVKNAHVSSGYEKTCVHRTFLKVKELSSYILPPLHRLKPASGLEANPLTNLLSSHVTIGVRIQNGKKYVDQVGGCSYDTVWKNLRSLKVRYDIECAR